MHQSLRGYTTALLGDVAREPLGEQIADDLNAVAHLVSRTNDLAVALTDFAVPTSARKAVLEDLLATRVDPIALKIVLRAVDKGRVEEFPTVLHELYELARHMHDLHPEELRAEEPIVSRTAWRDYMAGYSDAVFEAITETSELEEIEDELFRFARVIESSRVAAAASCPTRRFPSRTGSRSWATCSEARCGRRRCVWSVPRSRGGCGTSPRLSTGSSSRRRGRGAGASRVSSPGSRSTATNAESWPRPWSASPVNRWSYRSWRPPTFSAGR